MKRFLLSALLLAFCFGTAFYGYGKLENSSKKLIVELEFAAELLNKNDTDGALEKLESLEKIWDNERLSFNIFLDHTTLDTLDSSLPAISKILSSGDKPQAFEEIQKNIAVLNDIVEEQRISIGNIL